jgi:hypothetical protein
VTQPILKHRLNTLDATFYYYERKEAPFHVGSTMIFDEVELMNISFDHTPGKPPLPGPTPVSPASALPPANDLASRWFGGLLGSVMDMTENWNQLQRGLLNLGADKLKQSGNLISRPSNGPIRRS